MTKLLILSDSHSNRLALEHILKAEAEESLTLEQAAQRALELTGEGYGPTAAAKAAAQGTPYSKSEVYKQMLALQAGETEE